MEKVFNQEFSMEELENDSLFKARLKYEKKLRKKEDRLKKYESKIAKRLEKKKTRLEKKTKKNL